MLHASDRSPCLAASLTAYAPNCTADLSAPMCVASVEELGKVALASHFLSRAASCCYVVRWSLTVDSGEAVDVKERCCLNLPNSRCQILPRLRCIEVPAVA